MNVQSLELKVAACQAVRQCDEPDFKAVSCAANDENE